jgi:hypothetical protein
MSICANPECGGPLFTDEDKIVRCSKCGKTPEQAATKHAEIVRWHALEDNRAQILRDGTENLDRCCEVWDISREEFHKLTDLLKQHLKETSVENLVPVKSPPSPPPSVKPSTARGSFLKGHPGSDLLKRQAFLDANMDSIAKMLKEEGKKAAQAKYGFADSWLHKKQKADILPPGKDQRILFLRKLGLPCEPKEKELKIKHHYTKREAKPLPLKTTPTPQTEAPARSTIDAMREAKPLPLKTTPTPQTEAPARSTIDAILREHILERARAPLIVNLPTLPKFSRWWFPSVQREWLKTVLAIAEINTKAAQEANKDGVPAGE